MNNTFEVVKNCVEEVLSMNGAEEVEIRFDSKIVHDLGMKSLDIAQLIALLEIQYEKDPFSEGATLANVITIADLCKLYE